MIPRAISLCCLAILIATSTGFGQGQLPPRAAEVEKHIREGDVQDLAQQLVRIRSDYDEGVLANHKEMANFLAGRLRDLGMQSHVFEPTPNYPTVIGRLKGTTGTPTLGMIAHYNTVAVGDRSQWTVDPFAGVVKDGRLYGLGASDQKMPMAAALTAVKAIVDAGVKLNGDLVLLFIPGEGAQVHTLPMVVRDHPEVMRADWYLDTEGGPNIAKVAGGWIWVKITVEGITGHTAGRRPDGGEGRPVNAIFRLAKILTAIEDPTAWMTFQKHTLISNPLYGGNPVVEVGKIEGGYKVNQVPDRASAQVDIRLLPGQTPDGVMSELRAVFAKLAKNDPELKASAEIMTQQWVPMKYWETLNDNDPLVMAIREVAPPILGSVPGWSGSIGGGRPDIWATGAKWISFGGGGGGGNAHSPNEFASVKGGVTRATLYARVILRVLGS
jgi:acetylornithine deacetylase/succinyl-diaminopimelate desuccinylase-like protein